MEVGWQERAPRSLSENYVEGGAEGSAAAAGSTATPKPPLARPQDVFISVKTTGHYHRARLPVIIKTWFQLAKEQVSVRFILQYLTLLLVTCSARAFMDVICRKGWKHMNVYLQTVSTHTHSSMIYTNVYVLSLSYLLDKSNCFLFESEKSRN